MRFELIDRILERQPDRLVAIKSVTSAEEYLSDHFPSYPVLPGVMMLEALVQAARMLLQGLSFTDAPNTADKPSAENSPSSATSPTQDQPQPPPGSAPAPGKFADEPWVLAEARNIRYANMVRPGQSLRIEVSIRQHRPDSCDLNGVGTVDGQVAVQGRFRLVPLSTCR